jgi:hypothetical protein
MTHEGAQWEPSTWSIQESRSNKRNVKLARAIYSKISWGKYDPYSAHRWALKLIHHKPQNGLAVAQCLANYTWMIEGASQKYETNNRERKNNDEIATIFATWKAQEQIA